MGLATGALLIGIPAALGLGFLLMEDEAHAATPGGQGPKPPSGGVTPKPSGPSVISKKKPNGGYYYAVNPQYRQAFLDAIAMTRVSQETDQTVSLSWVLTPQASKNTKLLDNLDTWVESGYSLLVDPQLVMSPGTRSITLVKPGAGDPWAYTREDMAMLFAASPWESPETLQENHPLGDVGKPSEALSELSPSTAQQVRSLASKGPLRAMQDMADSLDEAGKHTSADWMRAKMADRMLSRKASSAGVGYWEYVLRAGELSPYAFAEAYLGEGDGPRYSEIVKLSPGLSQSPEGVTGWNAKTKIRIPAGWPDPEMANLPLGHGSSVYKAKPVKDSANIQVDNPPSISKASDPIAAAAQAAAASIAGKGDGLPGQEPGTFKGPDPLFSITVEPRNPVTDPRFDPENPGSWFD